MELLEKCQNLYDELRTTNDALKFVSEKLKRTDLALDEYERLYKEEFRLAMDVLGAYEDLEIALQNLEKTNGMDFLVNRIRKNAQLIVKIEDIKCL